LGHRLKDERVTRMSTQTILVVDDDPQIRDVLSMALERAGFEAVLARDGAEGLSQAKAINPSLAVLDIGLPEMDGLELCKAIRKDSDLPILFLTARDDEVDRMLWWTQSGGRAWLSATGRWTAICATCVRNWRMPVAPMRLKHCTALVCGWDHV